MSRLTTSQNYCDNCDFGKAKECFFDGKEKFNCKDKQIYEKLREYEVLEEQGNVEILPLTIFISKKYKQLTPREKNLLQHIRYHCIINELKNGVTEFPMSLGVEYGVATEGNARDFYREMNSLAENGFIKIISTGKFGKKIYKLIDFRNGKRG